MSAIRVTSRSSAFAASLIFALAVFSPLGPTSVWAQGKGGGNGNGGGGGGNGAAYTIIPFDPPGATNESTGISGLNDVGEAVGVAWRDNAADYYHVDFSVQPEVYTPLPNEVVAINNNGEMVGDTRDENNNFDLGYYASGLGAEPLALPPLAGYPNSRAFGINDAGIIIGSSSDSYNDIPRRIAVAWKRMENAEGEVAIDGPVPLYPLYGDPIVGDGSSFAADINDPPDGGPFQIVGTSYGETWEAVSWTINLNPNGTLTSASSAFDLGSLPGADRSSCSGNNAFGDICGRSGVDPIIIIGGGAMQPLALSRKAWYGRAYGINNLGQIVGEEVIDRSTAHHIVSLEYIAYLWESANSDPSRLDSLIDSQTQWDSLSAAQIITDAGVITGYGYFSGLQRSFIMWPNP